MVQIPPGLALLHQELGGHILSVMAKPTPVPSTPTGVVTRLLLTISLRASPVTLPVLMSEKCYLDAPLPSASLAQSLSKSYASHPCPRSSQNTYPVRRESSPVCRVTSDGGRHCFAVRHQGEAEGQGGCGSALSCSPGAWKAPYLGRGCCSRWVPG